MATPTHETRLRGTLRAMLADGKPADALRTVLDVLAEETSEEFAAKAAYGAVAARFPAPEGQRAEQIALRAIRRAGGLMGPGETAQMLGVDNSNVRQVRNVYGGPEVAFRASNTPFCFGVEVARVAEMRAKGIGRSRKGVRPRVAERPWAPPEERVAS